MDTSGKSDAAAGEAATRRLRTLEEKLSLLLREVEVAGDDGGGLFVALGDQA